MKRGLFWCGVGALTLGWSLGVYLPDRRRLGRADARRAALVHEIQDLWYEVTRLSKGEQGLLNADPYLWQQVIRRRLKGLGTGEDPRIEESLSDVR